MNFTFEKLLKSDLQLIKYWISQPHVSRWFDDIDDWMNEISSNLDSNWIWHFRADLSSKPVGFVQYYDIWDLIIRKNPKCEIVVQTNATVLNNRIKNLLETGNFKISISIDSYFSCIYILSIYI